MSHTYRVFDRVREDRFFWKKKLARKGTVGEPTRTHRHTGVRTDGVLVTNDGISETSYRQQLKHETTRKNRRLNKKQLRKMTEGDSDE